MTHTVVVVVVVDVHTRQSSTGVGYHLRASGDWSCACNTSRIEIAVELVFVPGSAAVPEKSCPNRKQKGKASDDATNYCSRM